MKEEFAVLHGDIPVGKAEVVRQGLYYRISCRYMLRSGELCRLIMKWPGGWENIGIPVPDGDGFTLVKKVPVKRIFGSDLSLHLLPVGIKGVEIENEMDRPTAIAQVTKEIDKNVSSPVHVAEEAVDTERRSISEDQPFEDLDRLDRARLIPAEGRNYAVFEEKESQIQTETNGAMIGAKDIGIDGCGENVIPESV